MSAKKFGFRASGSGSAVKSAEKRKPPTPKHILSSNLNSTMVSRNVPLIKAPLNLNNTLNVAGLSSTQKIVATDFELQCDFAYSEYLRALLAKDIVKHAIKEYEEAVDDQLSQQTELLQRSLTKQCNLESEVKDAEIQIEIEKLSTKLQQTYSAIDEIVQAYKVTENVTKCSDALENACSKLYLKNIKCFKSQEDYDKLSTALQCCAETMKKLKIVIGNTADMQVLGERMKAFLLLQEDFMKKQKKIGALQLNVEFDLFKNASDKFAIARGYDED